MRKPGRYWVKYGKGNDWECKRYISDGRWASHDGVMMFDPDVIGPRIPTPDEPWQCVPVEPTAEMIEAAREQHEGDAYLPVSLYSAMLAAAPQSETQP